MNEIDPVPAYLRIPLLFNLFYFNIYKISIPFLEYNAPFFFILSVTHLFPGFRTLFLVTNESAHSSPSSFRELSEGVHGFLFAWSGTW